MSMFTLAISCLTTSNFPWFVDLTFQVLMQYWSLQHRTLLSPPDASTTERHFHFGPVASSFMELLVITLCSSLVAYQTASDWWLISPCHIFLPFHTVHGVVRTRILKWFALPPPVDHVHLWWPCMPWLIASLSCPSPFTRTRLWPTKGWVAYMISSLLTQVWWSTASNVVLLIEAGSLHAVITLVLE